MASFLESIFGGGNNTSSSTQTIDPWQKGILSNNVSRAQGIADRPFESFMGQGYAPLSQNQRTALTGAQNLNGAGAPAIDMAINGAGGLLNYQPQNINPAMANTNTASAANYNPTMLGGAPQAQAQGYNASNWNPSMLGGAPQSQASSANAASIARGDVGNVSAGDAVGGMAAYQNPWENQVVDRTLGDINRQRDMALGNNQDRAIASRAFGGSRQAVMDSLTEGEYGRIAADTAAGLRAQGFNTAAGYSQQDAARGLQAQSQNQNADLNVAGQNAGYNQQSGMFNATNAQNASQYNTGLQAQYGMSNQNAQNAAGQFNAQNQTAADQYGATANNNASQYNAGLASQYGMANQNAANSAGQYNAGNQQQANLTNAAALNQGSQFNANASNQAQAQNQQAGIQGAGVNANAAGLLGQFGNSQFNNALGYTNALAQTGAMEQQAQQGQNAFDYQEFMRRMGYPAQGQQLINSSLGLLPNGGTTTTTGPGGSAVQGLLGVGKTAAALGWQPFG